MHFYCCRNCRNLRIKCDKCGMGWNTPPLWVNISLHHIHRNQPIWSVASTVFCNTKYRIRLQGQPLNPWRISSFSVSCFTTSLNSGIAKCDTLKQGITWINGKAMKNRRRTPNEVRKTYKLNVFKKLIKSTWQTAIFMLQLAYKIYERINYKPWKEWMSWKFTHIAELAQISSR